MAAPQNPLERSGELSRAVVLATLREALDALDALGLLVAAVHVNHAIDVLTQAESE